MAAKKAKAPAPPKTDTVGDTVSRVGWLVFAIGLAVVSFERGSQIGGYGAVTGLVGTLLVVGGRFYRDREARAQRLPCKPAPWTFPLGTALILLGAVGLLYPAFLLRADFRELVAAYPFGPLVAVSCGFSGIAFMIDGLDRAAPTEPVFALEVHGPFWKKLGLLNPKAFFYDTWMELDAEAAREREARGGKGYAWGPLTVFCTGAVFLALMEYYGHAPALRQVVDHFDPIGRIGEPETFFAVVRESPFRRLIEFVWWSGWRVLGFFLLPALVIKLILRQPIRDHGLETRGFTEHVWIYVLFFGIVAALVYTVSFEESFQTYYPFYSEASRSWYDFWAWEALYAAQFFSLEFFFRGFWLKAGKRGMGSHAIYAMVVPYCMIHFGKPVLETLAAIIAGVVLGTLALRTRSIWSGFLIHVSVAISMDIAALLQTRGLPTTWWPDL
ncbi:MAG: CPBP family intramembrane metalloprotease [Sandaracinaceae bacterium]|nr:CPBP family intramembrane metalloprotease [Sandaracinaceae bacterium]